MKQKKKIRIAVIVLISLIIFFFAIPEKQLNISLLDIDKIEDFDIILSKGQSVKSKIVYFRSFSKNAYSHIGLVVKENENIFVLHSTPDGTKTNGLRFDDLQTFITISKVSDILFLRHQSITDASKEKLSAEVSRFRKIQAPFDYEFNNYDEDKIYCSELLWIVFSNSGLFSTNDFNFEKPIYPKYFIELDDLSKIEIFRNKQLLSK